MRQVRYPLALMAQQVIRMADTAQLLAVRMFNDEPYLEVLTDDSRPKVQRHFEIRTSAKNTGTYVASFRKANDVQFQHVYEVQPTGVTA